MKKSHTSLFKTLFFIAFFIFVGICNIMATVYTTKGTIIIKPDGKPEIVGGSNWSNPLLWFPYPPGTTIDEGDEVYITFYIKMDQTIINNGYIEIEAGSDLQPIKGIDIQDHLIIGNRGTVINKNKMDVNNRISVIGNLVNEGVLTIGSTGIIDNSFFFSNKGTLNNNGGTINNNENGRIIDNGKISNTGTLNLNDGSTYTIAGNSTAINTATFNWNGGAIVVAPGFSYTLTTKLEISPKRTLEVQGFMNINQGGILTLYEGSMLKTSGNGQVTLNASGNMVFKNNVILPINFNWKREGTVTIAGTNNNTIEVPLGAYLNIEPTGIFNINKLGTILSISFFTSIINNGVINLNSGGRLICNESDLELPKGRFNWGSGGIVDIFPKSTLHVNQSTIMGAGRIINNLGVLNISSGTFNVLGTLDILSEKQPSVTGGGTLGIGTGGTLNLRTFNTATKNSFPTVPLSLSAGSTIKMATNASYLLESYLTIPAQSTFENGGKLEIAKAGVLDIKENGFVLNKGELTNFGTVLNAENLVNYSNASLWNYKTLVNSKNLINYGAIVNAEGSNLYNNGRLYLDVSSNFEERGFLGNKGIIEVYGKFFCGMADIWKGGTVNTYSGSEIYILKPLSLGGSAYISEGATLKIASTLNISSGALLVCNGSISLLTPGTSKMNLRTGGTFGIYSNSSILPDLWEKGSTISIGPMVSIAKPEWSIPANSSLYVNGKLTSNTMLTNNGTLLVNGYVTAPNMQNNGTIQGSGTIFANTYYNPFLFNNQASVFAPGNRNDTGTLTTETSQMASGTIDLGNSTYECDINQTSDKLVFPGNVVLTNAKLKVNLLQIPKIGTYTILTYGSRTGVFASVALPTLNGFTFRVDYTATSMNLIVQEGTTGGDGGNCNLQTNNLTTTVSDTAVALVWEAARGALKYKVEYRILDALTWTTAETAINSTNLTIGSLADGAIYEWRVSAICSNNFIGEVVNGTNFTLPCATIPTGLALNNLTTTTASIDWIALDNISNYVIAIKPTEPVGDIRYINNAGASTVLTDLLPNSKYDISIQSICSDAAKSDFSEILAIIMPEPCQAPAIPTIKYQTYNSIYLEWEAQTEVAVYEVSYRKQGIMVLTYKMITDPSIHHIVLTDLRKNTTYEIRMLTTYLNARDCSEYSEMIIVVTSPKEGTNWVQVQKESDLTAYPNPTNGIFSLRVERVEKAIGRILVTDYTGKIVLQLNDIPIEKGVHLQEINLTNLSNGLYLIHFSSGDYFTTEKVLLSK